MLLLQQTPMLTTTQSLSTPKQLEALFCAWHARESPPRSGHPLPEDSNSEESACDRAMGLYQGLGFSGFMLSKGFV